MRVLFTFYIALLLITSSINSFANESDTKKIKHKSSHSELVTNSSPAIQLLLSQDLTDVHLDSNQQLKITSRIKGEFTTRLLSIEAGMLQSKQKPNWNKYYFQGAVTLHQHNEFNVSFMANIEQINNFNHLNEKSSFLDIDSPITIGETELNYSYGIITSYSVSPAWQFSGGIIHAESLNESPQNTWYGDANMALIGTTYSF